MIFYRIRNGGDPIEVERLHVHSLNYTYSDIALLKMKTKLDYNLGILPICLPEPVSTFFEIMKAFSKICLTFSYRLTTLAI